MERQRFSPAAQLALLLVLVGLGVILGNVAVVLLEHSLLPLTKQLIKGPSPQFSNVDVARFMQVTGTVFLFIIPAYTFTFLNNGPQLGTHLGFSRIISGKQMFLVVIMFTASFFITEALELINLKIPLPKGMEATFKHWEEEYNKQAETLGTIRSGGEYIIALAILALLPAIAEESLFRGCLQKVFIRLTGNSFMGILITSILFSLMHGSYYGFLVRLFLGGLLGYIYYYSKNIWLNISMHFLNNAFVVTEMYAISKNGMPQVTNTAAKDIPVVTILVMGIAALAGLQYLFKMFKQESELLLAMHMADEVYIDENQNNKLP